ncbi:MAG: phosphotransferase family protein [Chloroflexota bacterium]|nr:phosphotransferase family protein [Dehalococcoidia bacterium]MDW8045688.1 phosphotransferase family protein [Chloroflexota bacterium]
MPDETRDVVPLAVRRALGAEAEAGEPTLLAGGAMHDSWAVTARHGSDSQELVVRVSPAGRADHEKTHREFVVLRAAWERGVACPRPLAWGVCETGEDFLVMTRMPGDTNPRQLVTSPAFAQAREAMLPQLAEHLARIHAIPLEAVADAPNLRAPAPGEDALTALRRQTEAEYRQLMLDPHPAIEWAFRWLDRQLSSMPAPAAAPCIVHGDFRVGNIMYDARGLTAILDWEGAHVGAPEEDIAWFCTRVWRFGPPDLAAGGIADREAWVEAYERASGRPVDRGRLLAWEVLQNIRWAVITFMQARAHLDGHTVSHELAAIGRRTAETELEILRLSGVVAEVRGAG